ncbi:MAG TPA: NIPSNAP family protein [Burkholderiaceae bacterium]|nr:NIPSNAP family protein [Burkholderiaceae bacterium]
MHTSTATPFAPPALEECSVIELRDYLMRPDRRDVLIELFEREFIETQEALGMRVMGHFRDLDRPDHYVWLRGFADMPARQRGLEGFYSGATWLAHRDAANATMIDSDDVRLLRYARPTWALTSPAAPRPHRDAEAAPPRSLYLLSVATLAAPADETLKRCFERDAMPLLRECGLMPSAVFETEPAANNYPRLPVRVDAPVLAWLSRMPSVAAADEALARLDATPRWRGAVLPRLRATALQHMRLQPAARSWLR